MAVVKRITAQCVALFGMMQLLFATGLCVTGFIVMGLFQTVDCIGVWYGLCVVVPGILSVVVLATRDKTAALSVVLTSVIMLAAGVYHIYQLIKDIDYWEKYREYAESSAFPSPCLMIQDECICSDSADYNAKNYVVTSCDYFRVGEGIFWTMVAMTIGALFFSLLNVVSGIWAACAKGPKIHHDEKRFSRPNPPEFNYSGERFNYNIRQ